MYNIVFLKLAKQHSRNFKPKSYINLNVTHMLCAKLLSTHF